MPIILPPPPIIPGLSAEERQWRDALWRYVRDTVASLESEVEELTEQLSDQVDLSVLLSTTEVAGGLKVIRGRCAGATGGFQAGEGFSGGKTGTGSYTLSWTTAFSSLPVIVACPVVLTTRFGQATADTTSGSVLMRDAAGTLSDTDYNFIAIGGRPA